MNTTQVQKSENRASESALPVYRPRTNLYETAEGYRVECALPGVGEDDVDVRVEDERLTLRATARLGTPESANGWQLVRCEFEPARYETSFRLGEDVDPATIRATLKHGLLRLDVQRRAKVEHKIPIQHG
jgi:HSP20 family protein